MTEDSRSGCVPIIYILVEHCHPIYTYVYTVYWCTVSFLRCSGNNFYYNIYFQSGKRELLLSAQNVYIIGRDKVTTEIWCLQNTLSTVLICPMFKNILLYPVTVGIGSSLISFLPIDQKGSWKRKDHWGRQEEDSYWWIYWSFP